MAPLRMESATSVADPYLSRALELASRGRGRTAPNPPVGAVIVRDGEIVGEGFHPRAGQPHAEIFALSDAGTASRGATMFVTLEPCRHLGRTPPCTDALIAAGIARVVIGAADPTPSGGGANVLAEAGIEVEFAEDAAPFTAVARGWFGRLDTGRPFLTAKVALSLDGQPALLPRSRASISGDSGIAITRALRDHADAILVGAGTVISDDPALTRRGPDGTLAEEQLLRVVLVRETVPPPTSSVFVDGLAPTLVVAADTIARSSLEDVVPKRVLVERFPQSAGLPGALKALGDRGLNEILIEPGPRLLSSLWAEGLLDELVTVTAGGMVGPEGPSLYDGPADASGPRLTHVLTPRRASIFGDVVATWWQPAPQAPSKS